MTFYFYPFQARHERFYQNFLPHLVSATYKLTPFQMQVESVLISLYIRSICPEMFLGICLLKICMHQILYTGEHPYAEVKFIKLTLQHGCSPVNLLHIFRTPFPKTTSRWLLLLYFLIAIKLNLTHNCWFFTKYALFAFCLLHFTFLYIIFINILFSLIVKISTWCSGFSWDTCK